jgi:hypothetical protein
MMSARRAAARAFVVASVFFMNAAALHAADAPTADVLKQVLQKRLLSLKPGGMTERNVLFEDVKAGSPSGGGYPFQVTATVRDYGPGYPKNKFYGETCVGRMEKWPFVLRRDAFGEWQVEGRMTITEGRECKRNPSAGVSSMPLSGLHGSPAPAGTAKTASAAPRPPAQTATGRPAAGSYECWHFSSARMGLNFTLEDRGRYLDAGKKSGTYAFDAASHKVAFKGGALDGQAPVYEVVQGRPKVSFRNAQGNEIAFCELAGR